MKFLRMKKQNNKRKSKRILNKYNKKITSMIILKFILWNNKNKIIQKKITLT